MMLCFRRDSDKTVSVFRGETSYVGMIQRFRQPNYLFSGVDRVSVTAAELREIASEIDRLTKGGDHD